MIISPSTVMNAPVAASFTTAGAYSYTIPTWCSHIDIIAVGGGGGGREGNGGNGDGGGGGKAGRWATLTLKRGTDIPWATTTITGSVGSAGPAGAKGTGDVISSSQGGSTTASWSGGSLTAPGGAGGSGFGSVPGGSPGTILVDSLTYTGGATAPSGASRTNGNAPGGGGGGGAGGIFGSQTAGMAGAPGAIFFYAYTHAGVPGSHISNDLSSLAGFSQYFTGNGVAAISGVAQWNGTTDGGSTLLNNIFPLTNNQYGAAVVDVIANNGSGIILHSDVDYSGYYGAVFYNAALQLVRTNSFWSAGTITTLASVSMTINTGDLVEFWNIGENFYVAVNATIQITQTISGAVIGPLNRYQGFGMFRRSLVNSTYITEWRGGDVSAWGKT